MRTRADEPLDTVLGHNCSTSRRDRALRSGAQVVSTDFPAFGMSARWGCDYAVRMGGRGVRCNPVSWGEDCESEGEKRLEPEEYYR